MPAAAPATAPAAPPASKPSAAPSPPKPPPKVETSTPPPEPGDAFADAFGELDAIDSGKKPASKKEAVKHPPSKGGADDRESDTTGQSALEESSAPNADSSSKQTKSDADQKQASGEPEKFTKAKPLREAYEALKSKVSSEYEPRIKELTTKLTELEKGNGQVPEEFKAKLEFTEKRNAELEQHMRYVDYQKSSEYQDKFWKPYVQAWSSATRELKGLTMEQEDPKTGETSRREVTEADLQYFASLEPSARRMEINRLFPEDKEEVKRLIGEIARTYEASQEALKKAKEEAETHSRQSADQLQNIQKQRQQLWKTTNQKLGEKYPHWFTPKEGDEEGNQLLMKGRALADLVFTPQDITADQVDLLPKSFAETIRSRKPFTQDQLVHLHSIVRNKAMGFDRQARELSVAQSRIAELEKSLSEYEESGPDKIPAGGRTKTVQKDFMEEAADELESIDRKYS